MYRIFFNDEISKDDEDLSVFQNIKKSELFSITIRPIVLQYNDDMRWIFDHIDLETDYVINEARIAIGSLQLDVIGHMYKLQKLEVLLSKQFLDTFRE